MAWRRPDSFEWLWRLDDARRRRARQLRRYYGLLLGVGAAVIVFALVRLLSGGRFSDRLAEIGDALVFGTLLVALIAGWVAVQAFAAATGRPDLKFLIRFKLAEPNVAVFDVVRGGPGDEWYVTSPGLNQTAATVFLNKHQ